MLGLVVVMHLISKEHDLALAGVAEDLSDLLVADTVNYLLHFVTHQTAAIAGPALVLIWPRQSGLERSSLPPELKAFVGVIGFATGPVTLFFLGDQPPFALWLGAQNPFVLLPQIWMLPAAAYSFERRQQNIQEAINLRW